MTQLQFLPYHLEWATWIQRALIVTDLLLLWWFWPMILGGVGKQGKTHSTPRVASAVASVCIAAFSVFVTTFPGEHVDGNSLVTAIEVAVPAGHYDDQVDSRPPNLTEYLFRVR